MTTITATRTESRTAAPRRSARTTVVSARRGKIDINWRVLHISPLTEEQYYVSPRIMGVRRN